MDRWPRQGIAGLIGLGHLAGEYVFAELLDDRTTYVLHLPEENVFSDDGIHIMDDGVTGEVALEVGGLIDALTVELGVTWFVDQAIVDQIDKLYRPENDFHSAAE